MLETGGSCCLHLYGSWRRALCFSRNSSQHLENQKVELLILEFPSGCADRSLDLSYIYTSLVFHKWEFHDSSDVGMVSVHSLWVCDSDRLFNRAASAILGEQAGAGEDH